jgi:hypothetical protein
VFIHAGSISLDIKTVTRVDRAGQVSRRREK